MSDTQHFPTEAEGLPAAGATEIVELADGDSFDLLIAPVVKRISEADVRMLAYNGSIPGPTLKVPEWIASRTSPTRGRTRGRPNGTSSPNGPAHGECAVSSGDSGALGVHAGSVDGGRVSRVLRTKRCN